MKNVLVTGGAGFIGSHLTEALVGRGEVVRVLDNFSTGRKENLAHLWDRIELVEGDIRDLNTVRRAMRGVDFVLHQAALPSVSRSIADPATTHEVNATGTLYVLMAAREAGAKRVVFASSSSVYGNSPSLPKREDMPLQPISPYACTKLAGEHYCRTFSHVYGIQTVCLRYFNVFGPRQDPHSEYSAAIPRFVTRMMAGEPPTIYGDGLQSRDFTYVQNVVQANLLACAAGEGAGGIFNVGCGERHSLLSVIDALNGILSSNLQPVLAPARPGDVRHSLACIERAAQILGYHPDTTLKAGLEYTVQWFRQGASRPTAGD
ncbi:MAG: SDR family oxidoreductase [candidate division NC10 bacterium]|nr:SDR family oxidoreductase [candidate division NC10 bacterium]